ARRPGPDALVRTAGAAAGALARPGARPRLPDRRSRGPRAGRAGARGRTLVAGPADPAAHAGPPGAGRTALPRRGHARQPSLSPRLTPPGVEPGGVRAGSAAVEPEIDRHDAHRLHRLAAAHRRLEAPAALHVARGLAVEH